MTSRVDRNGKALAIGTMVRIVETDSVHFGDTGHILDFLDGGPDWSPAHIQLDECAHLKNVVFDKSLQQPHWLEVV